MPLKLILKMIPSKLILGAAWNIIKPLIEKKIQDSQSSIDDKVFKEICDLIEELLK